MSMIDPRTPVMPGALKIWKKEVEEATAVFERAKTRLDFAKKYLAEVEARLAPAEVSEG